MGKGRIRNNGDIHNAILRAKESFDTMNRRMYIDADDVVSFVYAPKAKIDRWARLAVVMSCGIYEDVREGVGTVKEWYLPSTAECHKRFAEAKNILRKGRNFTLKVVKYLPDDAPFVPEEERTYMWAIIREKRDRNQHYVEADVEKARGVDTNAGTGEIALDTKAGKFDAGLTRAVANSCEAMYMDID